MSDEEDLPWRIIPDPLDRPGVMYVVVGEQWLFIDSHAIGVARDRQLMRLGAACVASDEFNEWLSDGPAGGTFRHPFS